MRKMIIVSFLLVLSLVLAACGSEETVTTMEITAGGSIMTATLKAEGDRLIEQTADSEIPYHEIGLSGAEEAEEVFSEIVNEFEEVPGVTHSISYEEDSIIESLTVNYDEVNMDEVRDLPGFQYEGDDDQEVSLQATIEMLEEQGFQVVE